MKAPLSFVILITIFSEPFFIDGSTQDVDINEQPESATHPTERYIRAIFQRRFRLYMLSFMFRFMFANIFFEKN